MFEAMLEKAEVHGIAGEIALKSLAPDPEKAEACFDRALADARQQEAKSWELRAAMSMARLWRVRASGMRPASFSHRSMAGSPKGVHPGEPRMCPWRCLRGRQ